jgi:hypothetical protein
LTDHGRNGINVPAEKTNSIFVPFFCECDLAAEELQIACIHQSWEEVE